MGSFIFTVTFIIFFIALRKQRNRLKTLEDTLFNQRSKYEKIQKSHSVLELELSLIEKRIDRISPETKREVEVTAKEPILSSLEKRASNTPLPKESKEPSTTILPAPLPPPIPTAKPQQAVSPIQVPETASAQQTQNKTPFAPPEPSFLERIPWRRILERLHLWPPRKSAGGGNTEIQLAAWWTARIGLIFLIIAAVFFGVYVSQHTPPILRVGTLLLVSITTIFLGARMKDKLAGFGRAIIGGGFALLYFTAFAAFALPPTKVIDSPSVGILLQLAALLAAISWSLWKDDQTVGTLTLLLGFVSCGFSHSHDLDRFTLVGLILLAATGSYLFGRRGWLTAFITALTGSWITYGLFSLLDWHHAESPSFSILIVTLIILTVLFEAASFISIARKVHPLSDRFRRWLILSNTSAAAVLGYGVTRLLYPELLSTFYFLFALLYFCFTLLHYFRSTDQVITETLFLKSSALLCLGFASAFDGPIRWLAIALQSFSLLWTARRSGSRWIAVGFALAFAVSLGWFWRDLVFSPPTDWRWLESFRLTGSFYLVFLTQQLALHSKWFPMGIGGINDTHQCQARQARLLGAGAVGVFTIMFALTPFTHTTTEPLWFLLILTGAIGVLSPLMRSASPCFAATLPALACYSLYATLSNPASLSLSAQLFGATLIALAFGAAELIRRFWPSPIKGSSIGRGFILVIGLITLLPFSYALKESWPFSTHTARLVFALSPILTVAALLSRHQKSLTNRTILPSLFFYFTTGILVVIGGLTIYANSVYLSSALILASLPLFVTVFKIRRVKTTLTGIIPLTVGCIVLWRSLINASSTSLSQDTINLTIALLSFLGLAVVVWKYATRPALKNLAFLSDAVLHGIAILSLHLFFQKHLTAGLGFLAAALLGLALLLISRRFPFRVLSAVAWLPIALVIASTVVDRSWQGAPIDTLWWWLSGPVLLIQLLLTSHWAPKAAPHSTTSPSDILQRNMPPLAGFLTLGGWIFIAVTAAPTPWQAAALTGVALLFASLSAWGKIQLVGPLTVAPLLLAALYTIGNIQNDKIASALPHSVLLGGLLTAIGFSAHGIIIASIQRREKHSTLSGWLHAGLALIIAFGVCASDALVRDNLTIVFWGLSVILLFICGLFAGLRAYRLTALIGLAVFCIPHILIWDVKDTLYRIIASLAIASVLLAIAFLYNKFRDSITAMDGGDR